MGVLMASSGRSNKPLHPTNLHVNQALFPNDTVQSRLPDPEWLEHWLDMQIRFDRGWEERVVKVILMNLSNLFGQTFANHQPSSTASARPCRKFPTPSRAAPEGGISATAQLRLSSAEAQTLASVPG